MERRKVVSAKNLPIKLPVIQSIVLWLLMDRLAVPGWVHGVVWTMMTIWWLVAVADFMVSKPVTIFEDNSGR